MVSEEEQVGKTLPAILDSEGLKPYQKYQRCVSCRESEPGW